MIVVLLQLIMQYQEIANPNYGSEKCIKSGDTTYYVGDIVIQIKNNYEAEVDMGDMNIEKCFSK